MKITFGNIQAKDIQTPVNIGVDKTEKKTVEKSGISMSAVATFDGSNRLYGQEVQKKVLGERGKNTPKDIQDQAGLMDMQNIQDQMILCAHTMSEKDYEKMRENGFDPADMKPEETVTILDKIKAELIKSGQEIIGYTDRVDMTTLSAAVGDEGLARSISNACMEEDIPLTRENVNEIYNAVQLGKETGAVTEEKQVFLLENQLEPTIYNLSLSAFSGSAGSGNVFSETGLSEEEIENFLDRIGVEKTEENIEEAKWLVERSQDVTAENIEKRIGLKELEKEIPVERLLKAAVSAISDGKEAVDGNLLDPRSSWKKSEELSRMDSRIRMEEIRLLMTGDANKALLPNDIFIDTKPIEESIEALKKIREEMAQSLFPDANNATALLDTFEEANQMVSSLGEMPIAQVGFMQERILTAPLSEVASSGEELAKRLKEAGERYETLMTAPRRDLGDSIKKAFRNVDDILQDVGMDVNDRNRQAVRTLAYCRMDINEAQIVRIGDAIAKVENLVEKMTPAAVLKMIKDGVNPMGESVESLKKYFEELPEEYREESEKYSRFLYHLEKNNGITKEERESFIGCYRLLRSIEKTDGAVIGDLVNSGAELTIQNLLSAVRSRKAHSTNVVVDDSVGFQTKVQEAKNTISSQIEKAFEDKTEKQFVSEKLKEYQESIAGVKTENAESLIRAQMPVTPENLQAAKLLSEPQKEVFKKMRTPKKDLPEELKEFTKEYKEDLSEATLSVEEETGLQEGYLDVKALQLMHKQLRIMEKLSDADEYHFPMAYGEDQVADIHLVFEKGEESKGNIFLHIWGEEIGEVTGELNLSDQKIWGYLVGNEKNTIMKLEEKTDNINSSLPEGITLGRIDYINNASGKTKNFSMGEKPEKTEDAEVLYKVACGFIKAILD